MEVIAEISARACMSNLSPTAIVASKRNDGSGTNGISEPKKLIIDKPR